MVFTIFDHFFHKMRYIEGKWIQKNYVLTNFADAFEITKFTN